MTTEARKQANRSNAQKSTGPRTRAGKAKVAQNALRHGLTIPVSQLREFAEPVSRLAKLLAGQSGDRARLDRAYAIAESIVDLERIRRLKLALLQMASKEHFEHNLAALRSLERYERRALSKRKFATRELPLPNNGTTRE